METFYRENTDIQELVDLLIEKLFTVCLLNGSEADSEFYRGKQAAEKISSILQNLTALPEEALKEGIQQLVEQRLPDPRVIGNFPQFYSLMEEMIQSGLPNIHISESEIQIPILTTSSEVASSKILLGRGSEVTENSIQVFIPKLEEFHNVDSATINVENNLIEQEQVRGEVEGIYRDELLKDSDNAVAEALFPLTKAVETQEECKNKLENKDENKNDTIPVEGEQLFRILKQIYPDEQPLWDVEIDQMSIFAQINILAFLIQNDNSTETEDIVKELEKKGLAVVICNHEDLAYPRRLERFIRKTLRKTVSPKTSSSFLS